MRHWEIRGKMGNRLLDSVFNVRRCIAMKLMLMGSCWVPEIDRLCEGMDGFAFGC